MDRGSAYLLSFMGACLKLVDISNFTFGATEKKTIVTVGTFHMSMIPKCILLHRCQCNGHANQCIKVEEEDSNYSTTMKCLCKHGTDGPNCEKCLDDHWDMPWRRATQENANECKRKWKNTSFSFFHHT